jgi:phosphatidate phosphatase APP1
VIQLPGNSGKAANNRRNPVILPYRGYGSRQKIFLMGRVVRQPAFGDGRLRKIFIPLRRKGSMMDLLNLGRRFFQWGIAGAELRARSGRIQQTVRTDRDGYFRIHMHPGPMPVAEAFWHPVDLQLIRPFHPAANATGEVFVPPAGGGFVVISDIDDTVMVTGVANKLKMLWRLFVESAQSRVAFPGVAAFYRALHGGPSGSDMNPMLYVSRGPWSIYELLDAFFNLHAIPVGPILFLREWGITLQRPLPSKGKGHKLAMILKMLSVYADLPFVLIGDSGQHDPEIYAHIVRKYPGRVLAIYIRDVSRGSERNRSIASLARKVLNAGSSLVLASDSYTMARHAAEHDLISPAALSDIIREREADGVVGTSSSSIKGAGKK